MLMILVLVLAIAAGALIVLILRAARNPELESLRKARLALTAENSSSETSSGFQQAAGSTPLHQEDGSLESKAAPRL